MALDPSIILQGRAPKLPDAQDLMALQNMGVQNRTAQLQYDTAARAQQQEKTLSDLYRKNLKPDGTIDEAAMTRDLAGAGMGAKIPGYQKESQAARTGTLQNQGLELANKKKQLDIVSGVMGSLLSDKALDHNKVIGAISSLVDQGIISNAQGAQMVRVLPGPEQLRQFLMSKALETADASKQIEMSLPKYDEQDRGGVINEGTIDPTTGQRTPGRDVQKTMTPGEKATQARLGAGGVSLSPAAIDLAAQRLLNGEPANKVLANFGRGAQGARDIAAVQNRFADLAAGAGADATEIALRNQELTAEARTRLELGAREGKIAPRVQEALNFAHIAKTASAAVPRGSFVPWTKLSQMKDTQLSDPNLAKLKAATLSLINAYAAAVGGGVPTVHDKEEATKILSTAQSPEAYNAVVDQLITETQAALQAPHDVMSDMRRRTTEKGGHGAATETTTQNGASVSNW